MCVSLHVSALTSSKYMKHKRPVYVSTLISTQEQYLYHIINARVYLYTYQH
jgi:hypothetical protein